MRSASVNATFIALTGVIVVLAGIVWLARRTAPHGEYRRLLEKMPPYDPSLLDDDALQDAIDATRQELRALTALIAAQRPNPALASRLRRYRVRMRLRLLHYEKIRRERGKPCL